MMKPVGIAYIIAGAIAVIGAVVLVYMLITLGQVVDIVNSANSADLPPGTDLSALQASVSSLGTFMTLGWVWAIGTIIAGVVSAKHGLDTLRKK
jgi:hypothetical protein